MERTLLLISAFFLLLSLSAIQTDATQKSKNSEIPAIFQLLPIVLLIINLFILFKVLTVITAWKWYFNLVLLFALFSFSFLPYSFYKKYLGFKSKSYFNPMHGQIRSHIFIYDFLICFGIGISIWIISGHIS